MKLILENWRGFLGEESPKQKIQIFCDMDGVLTNFEAGVVKHITGMLQNGEAEDLKSQIKRDYITIEDIETRGPIRVFMYKTLEHHAGFWESLEWMPGGKELWNFISPFGVSILTAPLKYGSEIGKQAWIDNHLNPPPERVFMSHEKYRWAKPYRVLIDDFTKNTEPWKEAGGIAILHTDVASSIQQLKELGF